MTGTATSVSALIGITFSRSRICFACQLSYQVKEPVGLADEQPVGREGFYSRHRTACLYRGRPNDRNFREIPAEERAGLGHDQIGLEVLPAEGRYIEVRKRESANSQGGQRVRNRVPALSDQVWKCMVSLGPMLSRIRKTTGSVTLRASVG